MIAVISIEGVLAAGDDLRRAQPTKWGRALYDAAHTQFRMIGFTTAEQEIAKWWLKREGFSEWAAVMTQEPYLEYPAWKVRQVEDFLAEGWDVACMLDVDPEVLARVTELGVLTLTVSYPTNKVGWKPHETQPRSWADVSSTL